MLLFVSYIVHLSYPSPPLSDAMRGCRSDWPGCLFCCFQSSCVFQILFLYLFHTCSGTDRLQFAKAQAVRYILYRTVAEGLFKADKLDVDCIPQAAITSLDDVTMEIGNTYGNPEDSTGLNIVLPVFSSAPSVAGEGGVERKGKGKFKTKG